MNAAARPPKDHCVRLDERTLLGLPLVLLYSQVDDAGATAPRAALSGCTEWASERAPRVSLGWDWALPEGAQLLVVLEHSIRSNAMLVNERGRDAGPARTRAVLRRRIDTLPWQQAVLAELRTEAPRPPR